MKSLIVPLLATASFSTFLICGIVAASSFNLHYTPHKFANINNAIWTSTPTRVDPSEQAFQREPGLVAVQTAAADVSGNDNPSPAIEANIVQTATTSNELQTASAGAPAAVDWCQARYKSYRESDNTYQPFSGGSRQQCDAPAQAPQVGITANDTTSSAVAQNPEQSHTAWCEARYSSYRLADDTYQPLGGGERRICASPLSSGANG